LESFYQALDCAAANNRLKRRSDSIEPGSIQVLPEMTLNINIETIFLTRTDLLLA
jgi:hypothetical protein